MSLGRTWQDCLISGTVLPAPEEPSAPGETGLCPQILRAAVMVCMQTMTIAPWLLTSVIFHLSFIFLLKGSPAKVLLQTAL